MSQQQDAPVSVHPTPNTTNTIVCILLLRQIVWDGRIESWRNTVRVEVHSSSSSSRRGSITNLD